MRRHVLIGRFGTADDVRVPKAKDEVETNLNLLASGRQLAHGLGAAIDYVMRVGLPAIREHEAALARQALRRLTDHDLEETASTRLLVMAARLVRRIDSADLPLWLPCRLALAKYFSRPSSSMNAGKACMFASHIATLRKAMALEVRCSMQE